VDAGPDEFAVSGTEVYLSCPGGYGRTKLNNSFFERRLAVTATTRNWKSVVPRRDGRPLRPPALPFRRDAETALRDYWGDTRVFAQGWEKIEAHGAFSRHLGYSRSSLPRSSRRSASGRFGVAIAYGGALAAAS